MANIPVKDGGAQDVFFKATGTGTNLDPYLPENSDPNTATVLTRLGAIADASAPDGSIHAKLRSIATTLNEWYSSYGDGIETRLGTNGAAASATGSQSQQLRAIAELLTTLSNSLTSIQSATDQLESYNDGIEGRLGTNGEDASATGSEAAQLRLVCNTLASLLVSTTLIEGYSDGIETSLASVNARIGTNNSAASATGSQSAQLRLIGELLTNITTEGIQARLGLSGEDASAIGSQAAQLRLIGESLTAIAASVDGIEGLIDTLETRGGVNGDAASATGSQAAQLRFVGESLTAIAASVDGVEGLIDTLETRVGSNGDAASAIGSQAAQLRLLGESLSPATMTAIATTTSGKQTIVSPSAGKALRISEILISAAEPVGIRLFEGTVAQGEAAISGTFTVLDYITSFSRPIALATGKSLVLNVSSAIALNGYVCWSEV